MMLIFAEKAQNLHRLCTGPWQKKWYQVRIYISICMLLRVGSSGTCCAALPGHVTVKNKKIP